MNGTELNLSFGALTAVKASFVLVLGSLLSLAVRRASASLRHALWCSTFLGTLLVPLFAAVSELQQEWRIPIPVVSGPAELPREPVRVDSSLAPPLASRALSVASENAPVPRRRIPRLSWLGAAGVVWLGASSVLLGRLALGWFASVRLARGSEAMRDRRWSALLQSARSRLGIEEQVDVKLSEKSPLPMTLGLLRPTILLPASARSYTEARRFAVLLHELAHVKRRDCLTHFLSQLASALYWWNPLVWLGAREMRLLSERASDDLVLGAGAPAADYAHDLLEMARGLGEETLSPLASVSMAHRSRFEERLLAILDPRIARRAVSVRFLFASAALALPLVLFVALATPTRASRNAGKASVSPVVLSVPKATEQDAPQPESELEPPPEAEPSPPAAPASPAPEAQESQDDRARARAALAEALEDPEPNVREQALHALVQMGDPAVVPHLERALSSPDAETRAEAAWGLGQMHREESTGSLIQALSDENEEVREQAAWALGMIQSEAAVGALVAALGDSDASVREETAWALGMIQSEAAVEGLLQALSDSDANVREQTAWALGMIQDQRALDALTRALKDADANVREQAAWALGMIVRGDDDPDPDPDPNPNPDPDFDFDFDGDFPGGVEVKPKKEEDRPVLLKQGPARSFPEGAVL